MLGPAAARVTPWAMAAALLAMASAGCQVFMNLDVDGYDAAPTTTDASCGGDAEICAALACVSSADCDAGQVCCLEVGSSKPVVVAATCQASACAANAFQLCHSGAECGSAGSCVACSLGGVSLSVCASEVTSFACSQ
jgi:hypothetical protein